VERKTVGETAVTHTERVKFGLPGLLPALPAHCVGLSAGLRGEESPVRDADGKLGREEADEVQQVQVQGPAPEEEQPHAPVQARG